MADALLMTVAIDFGICSAGGHNPLPSVFCIPVSLLQRDSSLRCSCLFPGVCTSVVWLPYRGVVWIECSNLFALEAVL